MPNILSQNLKCTFFLYEKWEDAEAARKPAGTGMFVAVRKAGSSEEGLAIAITNWHVAVRTAPIIRLPRLDGGYDIIDADCSEWVFDPLGDDLAALPMRTEAFSPGILHDVRMLMIDAFVSKEYADQNIVAAGGDVFMSGLFTHATDFSKNTPAARFGNISMMPSSATCVEQPTGSKKPSIIVDMRSRGGFSGSPVFWYELPVSNLTDASQGNIVVRQAKLGFIGLHWGGFSSESVSSGLTCSVPSWRIKDFLKRHFENLGGPYDW